MTRIVYRATPPTLSEGDVVIPSADVDGNLKVSVAGSASAAGIGKGGQYLISPPTLTDADPAYLRVDVNGFLLTKVIDPVTNLPVQWGDPATEYETVAASQTAQVIGPTGATGDYIQGLLVIPATTSPGNVLLLDNATSITVFTGGASSVSNLVSFYIPLGIASVTGAWKLTTGANVSAIAIGSFT